MVLGVVALVAALVLAQYLLRHEPVARVPLPDGTELRIEYVTYGTEHRAPGIGKTRAWVMNQLQRWPQLGLAKDWEVTEYRYESSPELMLWFTHYDPRTRKFLPGLWNELKVEGVSALEGTPYTVNHPGNGYGGMVALQESLPPMPHYLVGMGNYERRRPVVHLRVTMQGQTTELAVVNPAAKLQFPVWKAEPLPQTRRIGKADLVLRGLRTYLTDDRGSEVVPGSGAKGELTVDPVLEVWHDGAPSEGLFLESRFVDPTGNSGSWWRLPPLSERVWKLQVSVRRNEQFPFDGKDGVTLGPAPLPPSQKYHVFELPKEEQAQGLRLAALLGPGRYVWRDGVFEEVGEAIPVPDEPVFGGDKRTAFLHAGSEEDGSLRINTTEHALVVLFVTGNDYEKLKWGKSAINLARVKCGSPDFGGWRMAPDALVNNVPPKYSPGSVALCYELMDPDLENGKYAPPSGTPATVQIVSVEVEKVEFFVEAPGEVAGSNPQVAPF
jgi:hypothetical protein